ncbi:general transcription factor 3C polypeptide 3-like [Teleopsis dalmanni]|uniref:general transcription factor 3C polypeptide 3-like n=1 Tax=Teleopsis dalmanni TaxID=139649 RepID=UPI0018CE491A|nr:general transcription factor 3C polypeptide 3-like [Teleopsis dalmanni]
MECDEEKIYVEVLDESQIPENELAEFQETQIIKSEEFLDINCQEDEETLIKKFVSGESGLQDIYTMLGLNTEKSDDEDDSDNQSEKEDLREKPSTSSKIFGKGGLEERTRPHRKRSVLEPSLSALMGQANLSFARGQTDLAEKICFEIIRQNPLASESFYTLAQIYEFKDEEKFINFLTIAVHLNPYERDTWIRIIDIHIHKKNYPLARSFYSKAIKTFPKDYDLHLRKAQLLDTMGDSSAAMRTYLKMIPHVPPERAELCLVTAKNVAHYFHGLKKFELALKAMEQAYNVCGKRFSLDDLNLYLELLLLRKQYQKLLLCLNEKTSMDLEIEKVDGTEIILYCHMPENLLDAFRAKACVCLIHLTAKHIYEYIIENVCNYIPVESERLELYIDVTEAFMQENKYTEALQLLKHLVYNEYIDCPAFVWLRYAECLRHMERTNEAIESYERVVELAPFCYEAKFTLSALLKQQGRQSEALKALEQYDKNDSEPLNARLLYERAIMLKQIGEINEYLDVGYVLISRNSLKLRNREEMTAVAKGGSFYNSEGIKTVLQMRNITEDSDAMIQEYNKSQTDNSDLTVEDEYKLLMDLLDTAFERKKFSYLQRICFSLVTTKRFTNYHEELQRIIILACYYNDDCDMAFTYLRELITKKPLVVSLWNMLSLMIQKGHDRRYQRYVNRLIQRHAVVRPMRILVGHFHLNCSSYKYALNIYAPLLKENSDPLVALCIAVIFNQISLQKKVLRKSSAIAHSTAFAHRYAELRRNNSLTCAAEQEICYNIGRIYHQAGIMHLAIYYYERALAQQHPLIDEHAEYLSLTYETAYNLHLIYKANGNLHKARQILYKYIVI